MSKHTLISWYPTKKKTNILKIIGIIILILLLLSIAILGFAGNYLYNFALNPLNSNNVFSDDNTDTSSSEDGKEYSDVLAKKQDKEWLVNTADSLTITSYDNLNLHAYEISTSTPSHQYAIIVHGYMSQAKQMGAFAKRFYDMGFHVLLPDLRGHGQSEGNYIGMGWHDRLDILDWIDTILSKDKEAQIILFGVSMGAATVMMTSGEETLPEQVKLVIEDCGYTSVKDQFKLQLKVEFGLPAFPILNAAELITKFRAGYTFKEASAIKQVAKCKIPILFIHGDEDTFVPFSMLNSLYEATSGEKEKLIISGAEHARSADVDPKLYWESIENFINHYMK